MNQDLKIELFNIYDIVVFEDETGITQDCVCVIKKWEKEVDEVVSVIQCNNHSISIYENGSYKVWEKDGKDLPYYSTNKKIIHLYTLKNDNRFYEVYPISDYEINDNAQFSEAMEYLENFELDLDLTLDRTLDRRFINGKSYEEILDIIKQALLKAQEQKAITKLLEGRGYRVDLILVGNDLDRLAQYEEVLKGHRVTSNCELTFSDFGIVLEARYGTEIHNKLRKLEDIYEKKNISLIKERC